jgi:hypothetical protein
MIQGISGVDLKVVPIEVDRDFFAWVLLGKDARGR